MPSQVQTTPWASQTKVSIVVLAAILLATPRVALGSRSLLAATSCNGDDDCVGDYSVCMSGVCKSDFEGACTTSSDCINGHICSGGVCRRDKFMSCSSAGVANECGTNLVCATVPTLANTLQCLGGANFVCFSSGDCAGPTFNCLITQAATATQPAQGICKQPGAVGDSCTKDEDCGFKELNDAAKTKTTLRCVANRCSVRKHELCVVDSDCATNNIMRCAVARYATTDLKMQCVVGPKGDCTTEGDCGEALTCEPKSKKCLGKPGMLGCTGATGTAPCAPPYTCSTTSGKCVMVLGKGKVCKGKQDVECVAGSLCDTAGTGKCSGSSVKVATCRTSGVCDVYGGETCQSCPDCCKECTDGGACSVGESCVASLSGYGGSFSGARWRCEYSCCNRQCNNDGVCDRNEDCGCADCANTVANCQNSGYVPNW